jgi:hypothetical protein
LDDPAPRREAEGAGRAFLSRLRGDPIEFGFPHEPRQSLLVQYVCQLLVHRDLLAVGDRARIAAEGVATPQRFAMFAISCGDTWWTVPA